MLPFWYVFEGDEIIYPRHIGQQAVNLDLKDMSSKKRLSLSYIDQNVFKVDLLYCFCN